MEDPEIPKGQKLNMKPLGDLKTERNIQKFTLSWMEKAISYLERKRTFYNLD